MTTKAKGIFRYPSNPKKIGGPYHGTGMPTKYGTKQVLPPKKTNLHLPKGVPPLTLT